MALSRYLVDSSFVYETKHTFAIIPFAKENERKMEVESEVRCSRQHFWRSQEREKKMEQMHQWGIPISTAQMKRLIKRMQRERERGWITYTLWQTKEEIKRLQMEKEEGKTSIIGRERGVKTIVVKTERK